MRIAIVHYTAPPVVGGVERVVAEQARALARRGHQVTVVCGNTDAVVDGVRVVIAQELNPKDRPPLAALLANHDAIFVHNLFTMPFNLTATRVLRKLAVDWPKVHWVNWVHDVAAVNPNYAHLPWKHPDFTMLRQPPPNCTHVAVSVARQFEYRSLTQLQEAAVRVIPNGVDVARILSLTDRISSLVERLRLWERDYVIVHPARVVRRKNIELGMQVTAAMQKMGLDVAYLITGAPDPHQTDTKAYGEELVTVWEQLELEHSAYFLGTTGTLSDEDVRSLYCVSDAMLFPSKAEGFGLPIVEAALHGLPVFCSDIAAHREVGQGHVTYFDLEESPEAIAQRLMDHPIVTNRYERRITLAAYLDWQRICVAHLEPLLRMG
ncbi:MAG: putative glycosyltransferase [Verrucomicrobiaceae bacterium]|nr:putative glycosyltransferase [Verrucomicrobiaceae bacterium]